MESRSDVFRSNAMLMFVDLMLGVWLAYAPRFLHYGSPLADHDRFMGVIVALVAVLALRESIEKIRWVNVALGVWIMIAPFVLAGATSDARLNGLVTGAVIAAYAALRVMPDRLSRVHWLPYRSRRMERRD